ncbi:MAG: hypothetical protein ABEI57_01745 [Halapricum sp.]
MSRPILAHLAGYSTLTVAIAAAVDQPLVWLLAVPLLGATLLLAGYHAVDLVEDLTRVTARDQLATADPTEVVGGVATDGGTSRGER